MKSFPVCKLTRRNLTTGGTIASSILLVQFFSRAIFQGVSQKAVPYEYSSTHEHHLSRKASSYYNITNQTPKSHGSSTTNRRASQRTAATNKIAEENERTSFLLLCFSYLPNRVSKQGTRFAVVSSYEYIGLAICSNSSMSIKR
jgi:hypothetical protein